MDHQAALQLINHPHFYTESVERWADLGCGSGTFTRALADRLGEGSSIYAVDTDPKALRAIPVSHAAVQIIPHQADFVKGPLLAQLDGILMANSLHFVADPTSFLLRLRQQLKPSGKLILIEYDTDRANPWVPYPRSAESWRELLLEVGFANVSEIARRASRYHNGGIISLWAE